jgi:putative peptidoglycan lipid II flippase
LATHLLKSTATVGQMTLLSRIFGFIRDLVIARLFGASMEADAFFVAFRIPNLFRRFFAEGAFAQSFVPVLSETREQGGVDGVDNLVNAVCGTLTVVLAFVVLLGVLAAPGIILIFAPGFVGESGKIDLASELLRLTFPYLAFISLAAMAGSVLNIYGRFAVPAFSPVLLNLSLIGAALFIGPLLERPIISLALGVLLGGFLQLLLQISAMKRLGFTFRPFVSFANERVRKILTLMGPAILGVSVVQINLILDGIIASFLATGSISWLYYADRLVEFPLGAFGIALGTVTLPALSKVYSERNERAFSDTIDWALRWVFAIGLPASVGLAFLAHPALLTLFGYGAFSAYDVEMASQALVAYSTGLLFFILIKVLAPGYFARQDMRTPVKIALVAVLVNLFFNLLLVVPLAHAGLALATSISAGVNALLLLRGLIHKKVYEPKKGWLVICVRIVISTLIMGAVLAIVSQEIDMSMDWSGMERVLGLSCLIALGFFTYSASAIALGLRPNHFRQSGSIYL